MSVPFFRLPRINLLTFFPLLLLLDMPEWLRCIVGILWLGFLVAAIHKLRRELKRQSQLK